MDIEWSCRSGYMIILLMKGQGPRPREKQEISLTTKRMLMAMSRRVIYVQQLKWSPFSTTINNITSHYFNSFIQNFYTSTEWSYTQEWNWVESEDIKLLSHKGIRDSHMMGSMITVSVIFSLRENCEPFFHYHNYYIFFSSHT